MNPGLATCPGITASIFSVWVGLVEGSVVSWWCRSACVFSAEILLLLIEGEAPFWAGVLIRNTVSPVARLLRAFFFGGSLELCGGGSCDELATLDSSK